MKYNPDMHHRKSIRLRGYDYSSDGIYFITICTQNMECLFGEIIDGKIMLNDVGKMVERCWYDLEHRFYHIKLDEFIIMPDHFHGIISIVGAIPRGFPFGDGCPDCIMAEQDEHMQQQGRTQGPPVRETIGDIICAFKSIVTNEYIKNVKQNVWKPFDKRIWQRNYYDEIIRNQNQLNETRQYIINNPMEWEMEKKNSKIL